MNATNKQPPSKRSNQYIKRDNNKTKTHRYWLRSRKDTSGKGINSGNNTDSNENNNNKNNDNVAVEININTINEKLEKELYRSHFPKVACEGYWEKDELLFFGIKNVETDKWWKANFRKHGSNSYIQGGWRYLPGNLIRQRQ
jgi:hypothetical protein